MVSDTLIRTLLIVVESVFVILFCIWSVLHLIRIFGTKNKRQIVQIATSHENDLVLCDDNTLRMYRYGVWKRVPDVPQDEQKETGNEA